MAYIGKKGDGIFCPPFIFVIKSDNRKKEKEKIKSVIVQVEQKRKVPVKKEK